MVSKNKTAPQNPPALRWIEKTVAVSDLRPYEKNPRKISKESYDRLKASLQDTGYHQRIIAQPDLRIIGGHQRIKALQELGFKEVQVLVPNEPLTDEQFRRVLVQDNIPFGEFDFDMLAVDFTNEELTDWGMPEEWLPEREEGTAGLTDPDEVPEAPSEPVSRLGDIWLLGDHRLMCGDSTDADSVAMLLAGTRPMLMVTDPPYGVNYDASWRAKCDGGAGKRSDGKVLNDHIADWREAWALFPGDVAYVWHADRRASEVQTSLESCDFVIRSQIIWAKQSLVMSRGDYHWKHEPCWYAVRKGGTGHWSGDRKQTTLWEINNNNPIGATDREEQVGHSTQKPVECMKRPIENNSKINDYVYEPFSGSGTTIIAGEMTARKVLAMEICPAYVDMAITRWQNFTGREATHAQTGERFNSGIRLSPAQEADPVRLAAGQ